MWHSSTTYGKTSISRKQRNSDGLSMRTICCHIKCKTSRDLAQVLAVITGVTELAQVLFKPCSRWVEKFILSKKVPGQNLRKLLSTEVAVK